MSNFVFLGVSNLISEDTEKEIVDEVLQKLEDKLIHDDKDYNLTVTERKLDKVRLHEGIPRRDALGGSSRKEEETGIK
jgi:hypothetical protein